MRTPAYLPARPTRLIDPGIRTPPRPPPAPDGLIDIRTLPLEPVPTTPRLIAVTAVGVHLGSTFDGHEIDELDNVLPGAVLLSYQGANPPGPRPGLVSLAVHLALAGQQNPDTVAVWPGLDVAWPEIARTSVVFAARQHARSR